MGEWEKLMKDKAFITDLGENQNPLTENTEMVVGRYAVWSPLTNSKNHQVIEVGENLEYLRKKYHIPVDSARNLAVV